MSFEMCAALARRDNVEVDFACGILIPVSVHAMGYSNEKRIPYKRAYAKYTPPGQKLYASAPGTARSCGQNEAYTQQGSHRRKENGFLDDSIVRNPVKDNTIDLRKSGAAKVHMVLPARLFSTRACFSISRSRALLWSWPEEKLSSNSRAISPT
jgi:amidophosphoribosyltransferase